MLKAEEKRGGKPMTHFSYFSSIPPLVRATNGGTTTTTTSASEFLSGVDGTNTSFYTTRRFVANSLQVEINGLVQNPATQYTVLTDHDGYGTGVEFATAPKKTVELTDEIFVQYNTAPESEVIANIYNELDEKVNTPEQQEWDTIGVILTQ